MRRLVLLLLFLFTPLMAVLGLVTNGFSVGDSIGAAFVVVAAEMLCSAATVLFLRRDGEMIIDRYDGDDILYLNNMELTPTELSHKGWTALWVVDKRRA